MCMYMYTFPKSVDMGLKGSLTWKTTAIVITTTHTSQMTVFACSRNTQGTHKEHARNTSLQSPTLAT